MNRLVLLLLHVGNLALLVGYLLRNLRITKMYARAHLVHRVNRLVGHEAVVDVAVCQFDTRCQCVIRIGDVMVVLIAVLDVMENLQCLVVGGRLHLHLLEASLQGTVLLYGVAVLVERGRSDALNDATCQCGFHDVGGIHRTGSRTGADERVNLVDEDDDVGVLLQLLQKLAQALLKLSAVLCAGNNARHVERVDTLAEEHRRRVVVGYHLCQPFYDGALADARLTY